MPPPRAEGADELRADARTCPPLLEEDAPQGFVLAADVNGGFGGLARELLAQIRDDYPTAPRAAPAAAHTPARCRRRHHPARASRRRRTLEAAHRYRHALHDALALTSFDAELRVHDHNAWLRRAALGAPRRRAAAAAAAQTSAAVAARRRRRPARRRAAAGDAARQPSYYAAASPPSSTA